MQARLDSATTTISESATQNIVAASIYKNARTTVWFEPIVAALKLMAGASGCCMLCSRNEASNIEHYRPKTHFPQLAMQWDNFLWACSICNQAKGEKFPPDTMSGGRILNPVDENPWEFLFIDEVGLLTARYLPGKGVFDARARSTIEVVELNRDGLPFSRKRRLFNLREQTRLWTAGLTKGHMTKLEVQDLIAEYRDEPFQPDVADYFLNGPGRKESPFRELFDLLDTP